MGNGGEYSAKKDHRDHKVSQWRFDMRVVGESY